MRLRWERRQPGQAEGPRDRGAEEAAAAVGGARPETTNEADGNLDEMFYGTEDRGPRKTRSQRTRPQICSGRGGPAENVLGYKRDVEQQ